MSIRFTNPEQARGEKFRRRFRIFCTALTLSYFVIIGRGVVLMLKDNEQLNAMAMKQYRAAIQKETERGRILDRRGKELAVNIPAWSIYADPKEIKNVSQTAFLLSKIVGVPAKILREKLSVPKRFVWIKRRVDAATLEKILDSKLKGIYSLKENRRDYPQETLAGNILGAVGVDLQPLGGVELAYQSYLINTPESGVYLRDAKGRLYLAATPLEAEDPLADVTLTIDKNIQFFAEQALKRAVKTSGAKGGIAVVMDPSTGDILAMADEPRAPFPLWRNKAVTDIYEPGSTFKVFFLAGALEAGRLSLDEKINCEGGSLALTNGHIISDTHPHALLSVRDVIKVSSNIGAYKIAKHLGKREMYEWIQAFGFGSKTGIDFPGEGAGIVSHYHRWNTLEEATIAFGQGVGVTPLQMLVAYAAIANGGIRMRPHLVSKIATSDGNVLYQSVPEPVGVPLRKETAEKIIQVLRNVTQPDGTAPLADIAEYPVAGKTGTAQKVDPKSKGYLEGKYFASFIGFAPMDHPRLAALVLIDEPQGSYYGGVVAAPVFREMMLPSLQYLGLPPEGDRKNVWVAGERDQRPTKEGQVSGPWSLVPSSSFFQVPDFRGASLRHVLKAVTHYPVAVEFKGRGVALKQWPKPGSQILAGSKIYVEFKPLY